MLKDFVQGGGKLYAYQIPTLVDGDKNEELTAFFAQEDIQKLVSEDELMNLYAETTELKINNIKGGKLYHQHRTYQDGELIFLVNSSLEEDAEATLTLPCKYLYRMDAMTGKIFTHNRVVENGTAKVNIMLCPAESSLYFATDKPVLTADKEVEPEQALADTLKPSSELQIEPLHKNVLSLDFCNLQVKDQQHKQVYVKEANGIMWGAFGGGDPWEGSIQFRQDILERDTFTCGNIQVEYLLTVEEDCPLEDIHFIVERPDIWKVSLNGTQLNSLPDTLLDSRCGDFNAGNAIREGVNSLVLRCDPMSIHAEIAPVMVTGNFGVKYAEKGFTLCAAPQELTLGAWKDQLYPEYSWEMAYSRKYQISDTEKEYVLQLGSWEGTDAQVWVNGKKVGIISFDPYRLALSPYLKAGEKQIEVRIIGSLRNLYGPHHIPQGGDMGPWHWNGYFEQLAGQDYTLIPYGMNEDFCVLY